MGILEDIKAHFNTVNNPGDHQGSLTHEAIAGAAAFEAMKAYEAHAAKNGKPATHQIAKELIAGFAAAEADKLFETKGLDAIDRQKAKSQAVENATAAYDAQYQ